MDKESLDAGDGESPLNLATHPILIPSIERYRSPLRPSLISFVDFVDSGGVFLPMWLLCIRSPLCGIAQAAGVRKAWPTVEDPCSGSFSFPSVLIPLCIVYRYIQDSVHGSYP